MSKTHNTVAVCTRMLPDGEKDTVCLVVGRNVTVGELNSWREMVCKGDAVCVRFELVEQWPMQAAEVPVPEPVPYYPDTTAAPRNCLPNTTECRAEDEP